MNPQVAFARDGNYASTLKSGLEALGVTLTPDQQFQLLTYLDLLQRWNRTYNLTAIREPRDMLVHHLLDSLAILPALTKSALVERQLVVADVGSGAGLPGIPLAIAHPHWNVSLIEAVEKKSAFQRQAKIELGLSNVHVLPGRVEAVPAGTFDLVISRAFASLADFVRLAGHLANEDGYLCAMKGIRPDDEVVALPNGWQVKQLEILDVPGLDAQRHMLLLRKH